MAKTSDTYAVISVGGKQYRVREGEHLLVDRVPVDEGKTFHPDLLLLGGDGDAKLGDGELKDARGRTILRDDEVLLTVDDHGVPKQRRLHWRRVSGWKRGWAPAVSVAATPSVSRCTTPADTPRRGSPAEGVDGGSGGNRPASASSKAGGSRSRSLSIPIRGGAPDEARALLGTGRHASPRSYGALAGSPR